MWSLRLESEQNDNEINNVICWLRVTNSAARIVSNTRKSDHGLTHVRHDILHWLDVPERVTFKLCMTVYKCLHGMGPIYLSEMCQPSSSEAGRRHLRSANSGQLVVPATD